MDRKRTLEEGVSTVRERKWREDKKRVTAFFICIAFAS
jgi:hypothetical protein